MNKKNTKINQSELDDIKKLSDEADKTKGFQLSFLKEFEDEETIFEVFSDIQDPDAAYRVYYSIERMLKDNLPKGDDNKKIRDIVREEKNIFLNRGKRKDTKGIRHSDSRQAYIEAHLKVVFDIVANWVREGGNTFDLYMIFRNLNDEKGYREKVDLSSYNKKRLKTIGYDMKKVKNQKFPKKE